jgi:hypothetical protein
MFTSVTSFDDCEVGMTYPNKMEYCNMTKRKHFYLSGFSCIVV